MASWLERGRPALLEALNTVCDQIDADLRAGMSTSRVVQSVTPLTNNVRAPGTGTSPRRLHRRRAGQLETASSTIRQPRRRESAIESKIGSSAT